MTWRHFKSSQFARYLFAGAVNTAFTYVIYLILSHALHYQLAYALAYVAGVVISYLLNSCIVFKAGMNLKSLALFPLVYVAQYILGAVLLLIFVDFFSLPIRFAPLLVVLSCVPLTFVLTRSIVLIDHVRSSRRNKV